MLPFYLDSNTAHLMIERSINQSVLFTLHLIDCCLKVTNQQFCFSILYPELSFLLRV